MSSRLVAAESVKVNFNPGNVAVRTSDASVLGFTHSIALLFSSIWGSSAVHSALCCRPNLRKGPVDLKRWSRQPGDRAYALLYFRQGAPGTSTGKIYRLRREIFQARRALHNDSSILMGALSGTASAGAGTINVCSSANWPESTAWATQSVNTIQVLPAGNSIRVFPKLFWKSALSFRKS